MRIFAYQIVWICVSLQTEMEQSIFLFYYLEMGILFPNV